MKHQGLDLLDEIPDHAAAQSNLLVNQVLEQIDHEDKKSPSCPLKEGLESDTLLLS